MLVSIRAPVGALNIADRAYGIGRGLCAVRAVDVHPRFLWWLLHARVAELHAVATGSTYEAVTGEDVGALRIGVTSLAGQRAIADYLDLETSRIDVLIAKKRRMIELLNERWQSTMAESISGELLGLPQASPTGIPWLPTMPADWRRAQLNLIARLGSGHTPSRQHPEWWEDTTIPWITTGEVSQVRDDRKEYLTETREKISEIGLANSAAELHPADTVVLCRTASAGYSAIMGTNMATSQDFATWTCGPLLRPRFLLLCLRVMRQDLLGRLAMGSTHKTIYMPDIESILVPLPSVEVQDSVVEEAYSRLPAVDASIDLLARQIVLLVEHRQALITAAVTGEIDIAGAAA
ncbi:MAG: restriction endonuclease subunit S [Actinomycetota bacterium]